MRVVIGNGFIIRMWLDLWILYYLLRLLRLLNGFRLDILVIVFMNLDKSNWDVGKLEVVVVLEDIDKIF